MDRDLVYKQDVIKIIHKTILEFFYIGEDGEDYEDDEEVPFSEKDKLLLEINKAISNRVKSLPTADVPDRKVGKWIKNKRDGGWHCSCCGETDAYAFVYDDAETHLFLHDLYCPCCGARMRGEEW